MFKSRPLQLAWSVLGPSSIQPAVSCSLTVGLFSLLQVEDARSDSVALTDLWRFSNNPTEVTPSVTCHQAFFFSRPRHDGPDRTWNLKDDREQEEEGAVRHRTGRRSERKGCEVGAELFIH